MPTVEPSRALAKGLGAVMIGSVATRAMKATMTTKTTTWAAQIAVAVLLLATGTVPASSGLLAENSPRDKNTLDGSFHRAWSSVSGGTHRGCADFCHGSAADSVVAPKNASLSNEASRVWYNKQLEKINLDVPATEANARAIHAERNALKQQARDLMADRAEAARLDQNFPLRDFDYYVQKYKADGLEGEALWRRVMEAGKTPNPEVNRQFGIGGK
jgi:deoxycytidylate deaminase